MRTMLVYFIFVELIVVIWYLSKIASCLGK